MAVDITITFTDAQWALVQAHFTNVIEQEDGFPVHRDITKEELKVKIFNWVKREVEVCIEETAVADARDTVATCFEV